jgi:hypothetical protein
VGGAIGAVERPLSRIGPDVERTLGAVADTVQPYRRQARDLLRRRGEAVEPDDQGRPVVRGEVTGLAIAPQALARAQAAGFTVRRRETIEGLDLAVVVLGPPRGLTAAEAVRRLRALDPEGRYDFNHIYFESGGAAARTGTAASTPADAGEGLRIGLVDGSVSPTPPALAYVALTQRPFRAGRARGERACDGWWPRCWGAPRRLPGRGPGRRCSWPTSMARRRPGARRCRWRAAWAGWRR